MDSNSIDTNATERGAKPESNPRAPGKAFATPQGTMSIVLIYLAAMAALWGYMHVILLRSEGFWGGLLGRG